MQLLTCVVRPNSGTLCFASGKPAKKWSFWGRSYWSVFHDIWPPAWSFELNHVASDVDLKIHLHCAFTTSHFSFSWVIGSLLLAYWIYWQKPSIWYTCNIWRSCWVWLWQRMRLASVLQNMQFCYVQPDCLLHNTTPPEFWTFPPKHLIFQTFCCFHFSFQLSGS